jgi:hypothetical protein
VNNTCISNYILQQLLLWLKDHGNRTQAERDNNRLRIYTDKLRDFKQVGKTYLIATNYDKGAFYNAKETVAMSGYLNPIEIQKEQKKEKLKKENRVKNDV